MPLELVPPAEPSREEKVRQRVKAMPRPSYIAQCNRCGGREMIETKTGIEMVGDKPTKGTKQLLCAMCFIRGERVVVA